MAEAHSGYRIPLKTKLAFGLGASGESITVFAFSTFAFFYYNQVLGLSGTLAGLATTISLVFDAVSDPVVGAVSDRWRSRLGRRHPFMFVAAVPLGLVFFCIFSPPSALEGWTLFAWFTGFSVAMRLLVTLFAIPHLAFGAELSDDYLQRSVVMSYNAIFGWVGGASIFLVANLVYFAESPGFDNGLLNAHAYPAFGLAASVSITVLILACAWFTRDQIPRLAKTPVDDRPPRLGEMFAELVEVLSNRNYLMLLLGLFCLALTLGTRETIGLHMNTYYWELVPAELAWFPLGSGVGFVLAFALASRFHGWPGRTLLPILVAFSGASYCTVAILNISVMSMLADIADQHELNTGLRKEGIFYSARTFFSKATSALGHMVGGIAIDVIGFPAGARPGTVEEGVLFQLGMIDGPIAAVPALIAIVFYSRYAIDRRRHAEIQQALKARRASAAA